MNLSHLMFPVSYPGMESCESLLITGDSGTCKTSLLLQMACSLSSGFKKLDADDDCTIIFISKNPLVKIPLHVHRMPQFNDISAKNISIQYIENYSDLIVYLSKITFHAKKLTGIFVDSVDTFIKTIGDGDYKDCLAKLFALLVDLGGHYSDCQDGFARGTICPIIASFDSNPEDVTENVLISSMGNHFFNQMLKIEPFTILGTRSGFKMKDSYGYIIYFYIDEGQIFLDRISKEVHKFIGKKESQNSPP